MASIVKLVSPSHFGAQRDRRTDGALVRDVLGGALLLGAWLALWTVTWAAIAGPLEPIDPAERAAAVARAISGT